jgi:uncharacterized protein (TIGR00156 family)
MKKIIAFGILSFVWLSSVSAQFTGPGPKSDVRTVEEARKAQINTYVTVTGLIVAHLREDYYTFKDETGEVRVEIEDRVWENREVGPEIQIRIVAEVDRTLVGAVYLWVKSLEIIE